MTKDNQLTVKGKYELSKPSDMVAMASVLKKHIVEQKLFTTIVGKNYAHVEGWQFAGGLMGLHAEVADIQNLSTTTEIKWLAKVELKSADGKTVGLGFALCSNKESKKKSFDEYAILSMAQTRAIGKAYRNLVGWVMKTAGYETTPSEEMFKMGDTTPVTQPENQEVVYDKELPGFECFVGGEMITKAEHDYSKKIYGKPLCRAHQKESKPKNNKK